MSYIFSKAFDKCHFPFEKEAMHLVFQQQKQNIRQLGFIHSIGF